MSLWCNTLSNAPLILSISRLTTSASSVYHAAYIFSRRRCTTCLQLAAALPPIQVRGRRPQASTIKSICFTSTLSMTLPTIFSRAIGLYIFRFLKSPFFGFLSATVIDLQKYAKQYPVVRQWLKRRVSGSFSSCIASQSTQLGISSSPSALSGLVILITSSTSHILISGTNKGFAYWQLYRSFRSAGGGVRKKEA